MPLKMPERMFVRNAWYCAGWDYHVSQGRNALLARKIAGERVVLYRKPDGGLVCMEDRCCHRQAALSLGRKEGDCLRCMYHGIKFGPDGACVEIPGQTKIPHKARVRTFPVVEKNNWIWVWMGEPEQADESLICFAVGYDDPDWNIKTSEMHVDANYRLEVANLADLSHLAWVHQNTLGAGDPATVGAFTTIQDETTMLERGINTRYWIRNVPANAFLQHLFPPEARFDLHFDITMTVPCNWILHFRAFTAGSRTEGESDGELVADTYTCQTICPNDEHSVEYYFSWGASRTTDLPGLSDMLRETVEQAFLEDASVLEAQHARVMEKPQHPTIDIIHDAGAGKMFWVLDRLLQAEAKAEEEAALAVAGRSARAGAPAG
jgi:vanillate O-demethylase monooxygenase subunit